MKEYERPSVGIVSFENEIMAGVVLSSIEGTEDMGDLG